jgi:F0F1-type ATP synthase assembly protein I
VVGSVLDGRVEDVEVPELEQGPREASEVTEEGARPPALPQRPIKRRALIWGLLAGVVVGVLLGWVTYALALPPW